MNRNQDAKERAGLLQDELVRFVGVILQQMRPRQILLFGSVARGEIHEWSDLDLVVVAESGLPFLDRTKEVIKRVRPKVGMDVLVYTPQEWEQLLRDSPFVREEIAGKARVVYDGSSGPVA